MYIKDFTGLYERQAKQLGEFIDKQLPVTLKKYLPPIEIWGSARDVYTPEEIAKIKEGYPDFDPDASAGEWSRGTGTLRLYSVTFELPAKISQEFRIKRPREIFLHEFGHRIYELLSQKELIDIKEWDRVRKTDNGDIFSDYASDLIGAYGLYHDKTRDEDFAESLRYYILTPREFAKNFPHRAKFLSKLIKSFLKNPL